MSRQRGATIIYALIPIAVLLLGGFLVFRQYQGVKELRFEQQDIRQDIQMIEQNLAALSQLPDYEKFAAEPRSEQEQADFIDDLRLIALASGVEIVSFRALPPPPPPQPNEDGEVPVESIYQPMPSSVVLEGSFAEVREFTYSLMRMDRLLNTSSVRWSRDEQDGGTSLTFVVTRYVREPTAEEVEQMEQIQDNDDSALATAEEQPETETGENNDEN